MAAGMGSRYGGLKQMDPIGPNGEAIIDYSIYDALRAGFRRVVFVIKHAIEEAFRETVGSRLEERIEVTYAFQELDDLPQGYAIPAGREKPWGTTHALLAARHVVHGPFAAINADDYYGPDAFRSIYEWLSRPRPDDGKAHYAMVGYLIENTLSDNGGVTRGVCETDGKGFLRSVTERSLLERTPSGARYSDDGGRTWRELPAGTPVSMNFWGLDETFLRSAAQDFPRFLDENLPHNPLKCEYLLPTEIDARMRLDAADVRVLHSGDVWYGITYKEDRQTVVDAIARKHAEGLYPAPLWG